MADSRPDRLEIEDAWKLLKEDSEWLWFPVLSLVSVITSSAFFFHRHPDLIPSHHHKISLLNVLFSGHIASLTLLWFFCCFCQVFFNTALTACILAKLQGRLPSLTFGVGVAVQNLPAILIWTCLTATVMAGAELLRAAHSHIARITGTVVDVAWGGMTLLVLPVMLVERLPPWAALQRSTRLMESSFVEGAGALFTLGAISWLFSFPVTAVIIIGIILLQNGWRMSGIILVGIGGFCVVAYILITLAMRNALGSVLYRRIRLAEREPPARRIGIL